MDEKLLKEINEKMQAIENLLILQLIQNGATNEQISEVLQIKSVAPSNIRTSFSIKNLKKKNDK
ncbi:MAG: hypothetical protein Q7R52_01560 [archaeon]|nr:hypothetical protein [archaeon]